MANDTTCAVHFAGPAVHQDHGRRTSVGADEDCPYTSPENARCRHGRQQEDVGRTSMETTATALQQRSESFTVQPLSPALGAEIVGVDLRDPIDAGLKQKLLDAWHEHLVILLRNQALDEDAQVR